VKALIVWGGWEGHEPKQCADLFIPWLRQEGFEVTVSASLDSYLDQTLMGSLPTACTCSIARTRSPGASPTSTCSPSNTTCTWILQTRCSPQRRSAAACIPGSRARSR